MDELSPQERAVYNLVAANPFASQVELATALGVARPTIAAHIMALVRKGHLLGRGYMLPVAQRIVALGAAAIDRKYHALAALVSGTSNPASASRSFGGVARNVIENLARLGVATSLVTIIGDDEAGREILRQLRDLGVDTGMIAISMTEPTAEYVAILDPNNDLAIGVANMGVFDQFSLAQFERAWPHLASAAIVFADCNLPADILAALISRARTANCLVAIDTTSTPKSARLPRDLTGVDILFTNRDEAAAMLGRSMDPQAAATSLRARGAAKVVLTLGRAGCLVAEAHGITRVQPPRVTARDVTGAGDALIAGTLYRLLAGEELAAAARVGARLAALTVASEATVLLTLSAEMLDRAPRTRKKAI
jgi:pseudouridine kinase